MNYLVTSLITITVALMIAAGSLGSTPAAHADTERGKYVGVTPYDIPEWFKESFLEIEEDAVEASDAGKHLILFFHLDACPYCNQVINENFRDTSPNIEKLKENFDVIEINIKGDREIALDRNTTLPENELARELGVEYTPTLFFIDANNKPVLRLNGYRSPERLTHAFEYVRSRSYADGLRLSDYVDRVGENVYRLRNHDAFTETTDIDAFVRDNDKAIILFEDNKCMLCDTFHDNVLNDVELQASFAPFSIVRLDTGSSETIVAPGGKSMTAGEFAQSLGIDFRPTLVFFANGEERLRTDTLLRQWHYYVILTWLGQDKHNEFDRVWDYGRILEEEHLAAGKNIDFTK